MQNNDSKNDSKSWEKKVDLQINSLESRTEKMQQMFNKELEENKKVSVNNE